MTTFNPVPAFDNISTARLLDGAATTEPLARYRPFAANYAYGQLCFIANCHPIVCENDAQRKGYVQEFHDNEQAANALVREARRLGLPQRRP